ncbi:MAG: hypothetical protein DCC55_40335, partial [Chloroflexi bacterium]
MSTPKVSVIIPAYNGGDYLGEAIQSVLTQTYPHFELIVVDDASPKDASSLIGQFDDPRLKYIVHQQNQGAVAARKTGVDASSGAIIAFLDQDDLFHPEKLQAHVKFLEEHPAVGVTYNSRMECEGESRTIRSIWHPPDRATLADLVLGFPFAPSDTVLRRELALRDEIWDQSYVSSSNETIFNGAEIILGGRLALEGHQFASVGRALNYRRYHPRRVFSKVAARCSAELTCQQMILDDPRCPDEVRQLRNRAFMNTNLYWSYYAFAQEETALGHSLLREAVRLHPALVEGCPCELVKFFVHDSASDGSVEVKEHLKKLFAQLPPELAALSAQLDWAVGCAYLLRGAQAIMWNRTEEGQRCFAQAIQADAEFDEFFTQNLTRQLLNYQKEFGGNATQKVVERLVSY